MSVTRAKMESIDDTHIDAQTSEDAPKSADVSGDVGG